MLMGKVSAFSRFCSWCFLQGYLFWGGGGVFYKWGNLAAKSTCWLQPVFLVSQILGIPDLLCSGTSWASKRWGWATPVKRTSTCCSINASGHIGSQVWFLWELPVKPHHGSFSSNFIFNRKYLISWSPCETAMWKNIQDQSCGSWKWPGSTPLPDHSHIFQNKTRHKLLPVKHLGWVYPQGDDGKQTTPDSC